MSFGSITIPYQLSKLVEVGSLTSKLLMHQFRFY